MLIRRSNVLVSLLDRAGIAECVRANPDAVTLDLGALVADSRREEARGLVGEVVDVVATDGGPELFVRVSNTAQGADLEAALVPRLRGIMLGGVQSAADVEHVDEAVQEREGDRGRSPIELLVVLDSAAAVWNIKEILGASRRIRQAWLDDAQLCASMGIVQQEEFDALVYARGRVISESIALGVQPLGVAHSLTLAARHLSPHELHSKLRETRNLGFKGVVTLSAEWVDTVNDAFTPTESEIEYAQRVRAAFAEGVARGTAAVPLDGRMVDVPVDKNAQATLELAAACAERDAAKRSPRSTRSERGSAL